MDKSIMKRIKALEDKAPSDLVINAMTDQGELVEERVKDVISDQGELKEGFSGVGKVKRGNNLNDLDIYLNHLRKEAEKDISGCCEHN